MLSLSLFALLACAPPTVDVDGRGFPDLAAASDHIQPGSTVRILDGGLHEAGLVVPDAVRFIGPGTLTAFDRPVLVGEGALTLADLDLEGGSDDEGASLRVDGDLTLDDVSIAGATGTYALLTQGSVRMERVRIDHPGGVAFEARATTGRPATVDLLDVEVVGALAPHADRAAFTGLDAQDLTFRGLDLTLTDASLAAVGLDPDALHVTDLRATNLSVVADSARIGGGALGALEVDAGVSILDALTIDGAAHITGSSTQLVSLTGGTWQIETDTLEGLDLEVTALVGHPRQATLAAVDASLLQLVDAERLDLADLHVPTTLLRSERLRLEDLTGLTLDAVGVGTIEAITLAGAGPSLDLTGLQAGGVVLRSTSGPAGVVLTGAAVDGLIVVEPAGATGPVRFDTHAFATFEHVSWLGGSRDALAPDGAPVWLFDSLLEVYRFGDIGVDTTVQHSTAWSATGDVEPVFGLDVALPGFAGADDPRLAPDAPFPNRGAFASAYAEVLQERWQALR